MNHSDPAQTPIEPSQSTAEPLESTAEPEISAQIPAQPPQSTAESQKTAAKSFARAPKEKAVVVESERLQKLLSRAGIASRRAAEEIIRAGRVSINGHIVTELGVRADATRDRIVVDGHPLRLPSGPPIVVLLNKPRGVMTTRDDPEGRPTVMQALPREFANLHPIGRLDYDTAGLLLLTDDGELTQLLTHPSHAVEKVYHARVRGVVTVATIKKLEGGIALEDGPTAPCRVRVKAQTLGNALIEIALREGRNRQVRRMLEAVGHPVSSLRRVRVGSLDLQGVPVGTHRVLLPGEVHQLRKTANAKGKSKAKSTGAKTGGARAKTLSEVVRAAHTSARRAENSRGADLKSPRAQTEKAPTSFEGKGHKPSLTPRPSKAAPKSEAAKLAAKNAAIARNAANETPLALPSPAGRSARNNTSRNAAPETPVERTVPPRGMTSKSVTSRNMPSRETAPRATGENDTRAIAPSRGANARHGSQGTAGRNGATRGQSPRPTSENDTHRNLPPRNAAPRTTQSGTSRNATARAEEMRTPAASRATQNRAPRNAAPRGAPQSTAARGMGDKSGASANGAARAPSPKKSANAKSPTQHKPALAQRIEDRWK